MSSHTLAYLATPYTKYSEGIERAFIDACKLAGRLIQAGVHVYSPIAHSHPIAVHANMDPLDQTFWLDLDAAMLHVCRVLIIAHMDGWEQSTGVAHEIDFSSNASARFLISIRRRCGWSSEKCPRLQNSSTWEHDRAAPRSHRLRRRRSLHPCRVFDHRAGARRCRLWACLDCGGAAMSKEDAMSKEELSQDVAIEPIIFRSTIKDERQIIYVAQRWPEYASIDPCALRFPGISIRDDGMIVLTCENGFAIYKLAKTQISEPAPRSLDRWVV